MNDKRLLVVDDEKNIRLTVTQALEDLGLPVRTAVNGEEAMTMLDEEPFDVVFLDLRMPGMDGMEALRRIRDGWPKTRVIVITAHGKIESAVQAMKLGALDFVQKPFSPAEVRELALRALEGGAEEANDAEDYSSLVHRVKNHIAAGDYPAARRAARRAMAADPARPQAYNLLGALLEIKGEVLRAQKFYRAALDIDPAFEPAQANIRRTTSSNEFGGIDLGPDEGEARRPAMEKQNEK
ncbi:response regulator [Desulfarculus baarsii]